MPSRKATCSLSQCLPFPHIKGREWLYLLQRATAKFKCICKLLRTVSANDESIPVDYFYKTENKNTKIKIHLQNISIYVCMHTFTTCMNMHAIDICMYLCVFIHVVNA